MHAGKTLEVEQKFAAADLKRVEQQVAADGAAFAPAVTQVDRYYAHPVRDFAHTDEALRIRRVAEANFVTYKGPKLDSRTKTAPRDRAALPPGEEGFAQFASMLESLGFRPVAEVRKQCRIARLDWEGFTLEVALDDVQDVGRFVELETAADAADAEAAKAALASLAQRLGLEANERRSYLELLLLARAMTNDEARMTRE